MPLEASGERTGDACWRRSGGEVRSAFRVGCYSKGHPSYLRRAWGCCPRMIAAAAAHTHGALRPRREDRPRDRVRGVHEVARLELVVGLDLRPGHASVYHGRNRQISAGGEGEGEGEGGVPNAPHVVRSRRATTCRRPLLSRGRVPRVSPTASHRVPSPGVAEVRVMDA